MNKTRGEYIVYGLWLCNKKKGSLLGEEGFEGFKEATHGESISQFDTAVHGSAGQAKQLANRVAQFFHTINNLPVFLNRRENMEHVKQEENQTK